MTLPPFSADPTWSTSTTVPPPGFPTPLPSTKPSGYPPSIFIPNPSAPPSAQTQYRSAQANPNPAFSGAWNPPASTQYTPTYDKPSSWDIPSDHRPSQQHQVKPASCWDHPDVRARAQNAPQDHGRFIKMDPPHFDGSDVSNWISRVEYYFDHLQLPVDNRLHYVIMLFDPPAAEWVFNYRSNNTYVQWQEFLEDVRRRFDPLYFQNSTGLIAKLTQTGTLSEYNTKFESLLTRVRDMRESTRLSIYIEGLQQPVKTQVRHQHPSSLASAMALAVEFNGVTERPPPTGQFSRRQWPPRDPRPAVSPTHLTTATDAAVQPKPAQLKGSPYSCLPVIRLTAAEKADRTKRGLCWYCPEKYSPAHICNKIFLAYMGVDDVEDDETAPLDDPSTTKVITADISHLYAMDGRQRSDAIHLQGSISASPVLILVDTGSTHDFLHPRVAQTLSLPLQKIKPFRVYVGNGESLICSHASIDTRVVIQNHVFIINLHILPVHGPDVIHGMAWWKSLRRVTCDYDSETLEFMRDGHLVRLFIAPQLPKQV